MAQAANQADFLGEGTAAPVSAPGQMSQEELDALLLRQNAIHNAQLAANTASINNSPGGINQIGGGSAPQINPQTGLPFTGAERPTAPGHSVNAFLTESAKTVQQHPWLPLLPIAPLALNAAAPAIAGSGSIATPAGASPYVGGAASPYAAAGASAGAASNVAGGTAALNSAANEAAGVTVDSGAAAASAPGAAGAVPAVAGAAAPAAASGWLGPTIVGGLSAAGSIGGALFAKQQGAGSIPATPSLADRPEANLVRPASAGPVGAAPAQNTGNLDALSAAINGSPAQTATQRVAASPATATRAPVSNQLGGAATGQQPTIPRAPGAAPLAQGINPQTVTGGGPMAPGAGSSGIQAVDQALTNFRPGSAAPPTGRMATAPGQVSMGALPGRESMSALPGTGSMGAIPGTVGQGALPGTVGMGALPGATDRSLQEQALNRVLGYDANTASKAEAQLADAQQMNLSSSLALARSARGGPAAQAQALRQAQGEGAATMSQSARDLATLRAQEEDTAKARELQALGLGGQLTGDIRTGDIGERGQNFNALEAQLASGTTQRGQTIGAITADQASQAAQRGQSIEAILGERNAGVAERGQTIGASTAALNAGVSQRGQDTQALEAALNAGVTQRGQTVEQQIAERNAGVTERGQTTTAGTAANQQQLDAILGRGTLAATERNAGVTERGQTIQGNVAVEQINQARDAVAQTAATEAQKTEALKAIEAARLGYELTPDQRIAIASLGNQGPNILEMINDSVKAGVEGALAAKQLGL